MKVRTGSRRPIALAALVLALALAATLTGGCWDHAELEDLGFVLALGLDKGEQAPLRVTVQIAVPAQIAPGRSGSGPGVITETVEGFSLDQVITYISSFRHKQITLGHNKLVVFGKELAEQGILAWLGETVRDREMRRSNDMLISTGTAAEILQALNTERNPAAAIEELLLLTRYTGLAPRVTLHEWLTDYEGRIRAPVAPVIGPPRSPEKSGLDQGGNDSGGGGGSSGGGGAGHETGAGAQAPPKLQVMGTAVFRGDRLVDIMSGLESQVYLMMTGRLSRTVLSMPLKEPQAEVTIRVKGEKPKSSLTYVGSTAEIKQTLVFEGDITQFVYRGRYLTNQKELDNVAKQVGDHVKGIAQELVTRMQGLGVDPFQYGGLVRRRLSSYEEWRQFDWVPVYQKAEVSIEVKSFVRRTGATLWPLREVRPDSQGGG